MPPPMFSFEFRCVGSDPKAEYPDKLCGQTIMGRAYLAVVKGEGHRLECPICHQLYLIKEDGAHPVESFDEPINFLDAAGKPFTLSNWDPSMADIPVPKFPPIEGLTNG